MVALGLAAALTFAGGGLSSLAQDAKSAGESIPLTMLSSISPSGAATSESSESAFESLVANGSISWVFSAPTSESTTTGGIFEAAPYRIGSSVVATGLTGESVTTASERIPMTINAAIESYSSTSRVGFAVLSALQSDETLEQVGLGAVGIAIGNGPSSESSETTIEQVGLGAVGVAIGGGPATESGETTIEQIGLGAVGVAIGGGPASESTGTELEQVGQGVVENALGGGPETESGGIDRPEQLSPFGLNSSRIDG